MIGSFLRKGVAQLPTRAVRIVIFWLIFIFIFTTVSASAASISVEDAQLILDRHGYRPGPIDGLLGEKTRDSILAFQKAHGLPEKTGYIDEETKIALRNAIELEPKKKRSGIHIEVDIDRQLLYLVENGSIRNILNTSTGKDDRTPRGTFQIYDKVTEGWVDAIGRDGSVQGRMYKPIKFYGLYYIHGSDYVPSYPASLGCVRVHPRHMNFLHEKTDLKTEVIIY